ncbi:hypothetical protein WOLCODRAFT_138756 [Wolfiporia cocos MD-104 SS10]|uniref:Uncharacterized protein n=1 Tax=Wolfiporia cocos (strain MD-104) TaxID=742152 RepID=A0A2H3K4R1_WOLCO|nr:hypothetical protein WOLCODRAFT_138756 [Wolfiporia cocos MD-104 SS10]
MTIPPVRIDHDGHDLSAEVQQLLWHAGASLQHLSFGLCLPTSGKGFHSYAPDYGCLDFSDNVALETVEVTVIVTEKQINSSSIDWIPRFLFQSRSVPSLKWVTWRFERLNSSLRATDVLPMLESCSQLDEILDDRQPSLRLEFDMHADETGDADDILEEHASTYFPRLAERLTRYYT